MTKPKSEKPKDDPKVRSIALNPNPKGEFKMVGGSLADDWNMRLLNGVGGALPVQHSDIYASNEAITAIGQAMIDMKPADPTEGMLIAQLIAANEAALTLYRKGWQNVNVPEYFEGGTKFLQLADKAARTVALLTERLDHHRGRGQQQITVKHVTTNNVTADQAIIADSVTTGAGRNVASPALLAASSETPMPIVDEIIRPDPVGVGRGEKTK
jgi:hypothetical protein